MAAISFPAAFDCGGSGGERLRAAKTRLALALAVSVLLHAWLAGSKAVEAPKRPVPRAVSTLTARLEPAAASAGAEAQTQPESTPAPVPLAQVKPAPGAVAAPMPVAANDYLLAHQAFSPRVSLQGMAPYVRSVSDER